MKQPASKLNRKLYGVLIAVLIIVLAGVWWYFNDPNIRTSSTLPTYTTKQEAPSTEEPRETDSLNGTTGVRDNIF